MHRCSFGNHIVDEPQDVIISGLPFFNMGPRAVRAIVDRYRNLALPGATITWFSARGSYRGRQMTARPAAINRHRQVRTVLTDARGQRQHSAGQRAPARVTRIHIPA